MALGLLRSGELKVLASLSSLLPPTCSLSVRFASKKQGGSTSNGRDSKPKFLGLKHFGGAVRAQAGSASGGERAGGATVRGALQWCNAAPPRPPLLAGVAAPAPASAAQHHPAQPAARPPAGRWQAGSLP